MTPFFSNESKNIEIAWKTNNIFIWMWNERCIESLRYNGIFLPVTTNAEHPAIAISYALYSEAESKTKRNETHFNINPFHTMTTQKQHAHFGMAPRSASAHPTILPPSHRHRSSSSELPAVKVKKETSHKNPMFIYEQQHICSQCRRRYFCLAFTYNVGMLCDAMEDWKLCIFKL